MADDIYDKINWDLIRSKAEEDLRSLAENYCNNDVIELREAVEKLHEENNRTM